MATRKKLVRLITNVPKVKGTYESRLKSDEFRGVAGVLVTNIQDMTVGGGNDVWLKSEIRKQEYETFDATARDSIGFVTPRYSRVGVYELYIGQGQAVIPFASVPLLFGESWRLFTEVGGTATDAQVTFQQNIYLIGD